MDYTKLSNYELSKDGSSAATVELNMRVLEAQRQMKSLSDSQLIMRALARLTNFEDRAQVNIRALREELKVRSESRYEHIAE